MRNGALVNVLVAPRRVASDAVATVKLHLFLVEAYPAEHALGVALALAHALQGVDAAAVQQAEVAHILQHVKARRALQQFVELDGQPLAQPTLLASRAAPRIHILVALFPILEHLGNECGRVLQVGIDDDHAVAGDIVKAREHGDLLAEVARQVHIVDAFVLLPQLLQDVQRVVGTAVVDEHDFPLIVGQSLHEFHQFRIEQRQRFLLVVARYEYGYLFHCRLLSCRYVFNKSMTKVVILCQTCK